MEELDEDKIVTLAKEYAESRLQFFKPWEGSYKLACENAFVNAYMVGYYAKCKEIDPEFEIPQLVQDVSKSD